MIAERRNQLAWWTDCKECGGGWWIDTDPEAEGWPECECGYRMEGRYQVEIRPLFKCDPTHGRGQERWRERALKAERERDEARALARQFAKYADHEQACRQSGDCTCGLDGLFDDVPGWLWRSQEELGTLLEDDAC